MLKSDYGSAEVSFVWVVPFAQPGAGSVVLGRSLDLRCNPPIAPECRHYLGDRPCVYRRACQGCDHYAPYSHRICIIKLGALGDVVRTLCILPELRRRYPDGHITWVSLPNGCRMIREHSMINRVMPFDAMSAMMLQQEQFDLVICLDKEPAPCALAMAIRAKQKLGIGLSRHGTPIPLNRECEPYFHLGLNDDLKFRQNTRSYPHLIYEALGWRYNSERYELPLNEKAADQMRLHLMSEGWRPEDATIGIFVGAGRVFANKMWPAETSIEVIRHLRRGAPQAKIVLLGGPDERSAIDHILYELRRSGESENIIDSGTEHDEPSFVALVDACDVLLSGDTMAMHVALARGKRVVVYFGPTCEQEIDLFGQGEKLIAHVPCGPCYKRVCDQGDVCVKAIVPEDAAAAVLRQLAQCNSPATLPLRVLPLRRTG